MDRTDGKNDSCSKTAPTSPYKGSEGQCALPQEVKLLWCPPSLEEAAEPSQPRFPAQPHSLSQRSSVPLPAMGSSVLLRQETPWATTWESVGNHVRVRAVSVISPRECPWCVCDQPTSMSLVCL